MQEKSKIKEMYLILESMLTNTLEGNSEKVSKLNGFYEALALKSYHNPLTDLDLQYDGCRSSCVVSFGMQSIRNELILDAKKRFEKIPRPYK